jgi:hypothetical protein
VAEHEKARAEQLEREVKQALGQAMPPPEARKPETLDPKKAGRTKTELIKKLLARLNAAPDRVGFPKSNLR